MGVPKALGLAAAALLTQLCFGAPVQGGGPAFVAPTASRQLLGSRPAAGLMNREGVRRTVMMAGEQGRGAGSDFEGRMTRRNVGTLAAWMLAMAASKPEVQAATPAATFFEEDYKNGFKSYTNGSRSLFYKDVVEGLGIPPKEGDMLRFQLAAYLPDGTLVSIYEGVERKITLGKGEVPFALEEGLRGMKVSGERILVFEPVDGFNPAWRRRSLEFMRGCEDETTCRLNTDRLIVRVILVGYNKAECLNGDMPVSVDASTMLTEGKVQFTIGSDLCPEGNTEVTAQRIKTMEMINKLKQEGKLKAEEKQEFKIP